MNSSNPPVVVGLGELLFDLLPSGRKLGGAPANFAHHAQQLGMAGWVCSAVGEDALGQALLECVESTGLKACVERVAAPTGVVEVSLDEDGQPSYHIAEGAAWDQIPFTENVESLAQRSDAVCFGSLAQRDSVSRQTIERFLKATPDRCLKVFDVNMRQGFWTPEVITSSCQAADIVKVNEQEWIVLAELFDLAESPACGLAACYRLQIDAAKPQAGDQFPGWPLTIDMADNYGRNATAYLPELRISGMKNPVVQVIRESSGEVLYTRRIFSNTYQPRTFSKSGLHTVKVGEPGGKMKTFKGLHPGTLGSFLEVKFD